MRAPQNPTERLVYHGWAPPVRTSYKKASVFDLALCRLLGHFSLYCPVHSSMKNAMKISNTSTQFPESRTRCHCVESHTKDTIEAKEEERLPGVPLIQ